MNDEALVRADMQYSPGTGTLREICITIVVLYFWHDNYVLFGWNDVQLWC